MDLPADMAVPEFQAVAHREGARTARLGRMREAGCAEADTTMNFRRNDPLWHPAASLQ
jgi:hypothetical protein